ncbi:MAG: peptidase S41 [Candidatus Symbiothrix sp.]|jgi:Tol biopolymer transport system component/C-terminal processing protease CtpA/Prc|nr:peptidase S41 [Candidatus Symbiothrix sp.]
MKKLFGFWGLLVCLTCSVAAQNSPLWLRYPSISPDGQQIAFSYKGDIFTVPTAGGQARQITMHEAYDYLPVWSPDSKKIAFASNRFGNFDVYTVSATGGTPERLTTHSANESPYSFTPDGKFVVFGAKIQVPASSAAFPSNVNTELYKVAVTGGRPELVLATSIEDLSFSADGKTMIYQDKKGNEDKWRKHHTSSVTKDLWQYDFATKQFTQLIDKPGEDRNPVFSPDNSHVYFLSERSGTFNVWTFPLTDPAQTKQVTTFKTNPVRFLSIAKNGTLCFAYDGEIYTLATNGKPSKVSVSITEEAKKNDLETISRGASARAISADGKQVASVLRGEIFVSSTDYKYTKRITNTASRDDHPNFSPDGKSLIYASERTGTWNLYIATPARKEESHLFNATVIKEEPLLPSDKIEYMYPKYSPDGKEIAFIQDRHKLMVYTIASKKVRQVTDGSGNPGTSGDVDYEWSPDSKWFTIAYTANRHDPYTDIGLVSAQGGEITNLTNSGYTSGNPRWALEGNAILFQTERYGMRNHASWGSLNDAMLVFMNQKAYDKYRLSEDDFKLLEETEKAAKKGTEKKGENSTEGVAGQARNDKARNDKTNNDSTTIIVELKGIADRMVRVTPNSSDMGDAVLTNDGGRLYYLAAFEKDRDLWSINTRTRETKLEIKGIGRGSLFLDKDGKVLYAFGGSGAQKITLSSSKKEPVTIKAEFELDKAAEREYMFNHAWTQEFKRFYVKDLHGTDWAGYKKIYAKFLPYINNNFDFSDMLGEMLGELNSSHNGSRYRPVPANPDETANLGLLFSWTYNKDGLLVDEVLEKGPFDRAESKVKAGDILESINGEKIVAGKDYYPVLNKIKGENTLLTFYNPTTKARWDEVIKPVAGSAVTDLLYDRWVKQREADVERLSNGRLGYVHIQSMGDPSFRSIYSDILGKFNNKEAIVIDTRFNGGGRLHEDLEILFSGQKYFEQVIRDVETCDMPSRRWNKPSIMLMGEANYSNAHGSPWVYQHVGIGKLVGMPVPGTMTTVSWETQQDPTLIFGIPVVGYRLPNGNYLENTQLEPDVKIANTPNKLSQGTDEQLAKAVETLLNSL